MRGTYLRPKALNNLCLIWVNHFEEYLGQLFGTKTPVLHSTWFNRVSNTETLITTYPDLIS